MRRSDLEHIIRASGDIAGDDEIIVVGSQAILGQIPDAPVQLLASMEADVFPKNKPELADRIDGAIGEGSAFHEEFGYYAQGVSAETATLPSGWRSRLVRICNENTRGVSGLCLEVHDLAVSKLIAGRLKDLEYVHELVRAGIIRKEILLRRMKETEIANPERKRVARRIAALFRG